MTRARTDDRYYFAVGALFAVIVFAGFARTFFLRARFGGADLTPVLQLHGGVMTAWYALFLVQVLLVASRRVSWHRALGYAGIGLAAAVAWLGAGVSMDLARRELERNPADVGTRVLFALQLASMVLPFVVFTALGVIYRRRPEVHKRLMVMAMLTVLAPAVTRLPLGRAFEHNVPLAALAAEATILLCISIDWMRTRRLHPVFGWGFVLPLVLMAGVAAFAQTATWRAVSDAMLGRPGLTSTVP